MKSLLSTFIDTVLLIEDFGESIDRLYANIKTVAVEANSYIAFIALALLCHGKETVSVKDNLELDSTEIKLVQRLFLDNSDILSLTEELLFLITCIHTSDSSDAFVKLRLNYMFSTEIVNERSEVAFWIYHKYIEDDREARRLKYLTIYIINDWITKNTLI